MRGLLEVLYKILAVYHDSENKQSEIWVRGYAQSSLAQNHVNFSTE